MPTYLKVWNQMEGSDALWFSVLHSESPFNLWMHSGFSPFILRVTKFPRSTKAIHTSCVSFSRHFYSTHNFFFILLYLKCYLSSIFPAISLWISLSIINGRTSELISSCYVTSIFSLSVLCLHLKQIFLFIFQIKF